MKSFFENGVNTKILAQINKFNEKANLLWSNFLGISFQSLILSSASILVKHKTTILNHN